MNLDSKRKKIIYKLYNYLEFGSKCLTMEFPLGKICETGVWRALEGSAKFSSLQRKQITSTIQIFPIQRHTESPPPPSSRTFLEWSQLQTLTWGSPAFFNAVNASNTVASAWIGFSGGLPRHRSDTSRFRKLTAMQMRILEGDLRRRPENYLPVK